MKMSEPDDVKLMDAGLISDEKFQSMDYLKSLDFAGSMTSCSPKDDSGREGNVHRSEKPRTRASAQFGDGKTSGDSDQSDNETCSMISENQKNICIAM
jgi:hypothetical protein